MALCYLLILWLLKLVHFACSSSVQITTQLGEIRGNITNSVSQFYNIPYAEPPIGELRWKRTRSLQSTWNGVYDATKWGNACVQPTYTQLFSADANPKFIEDCLYLNIFTPYQFNDKSSTQKLRPVLFWYVTYMIIYILQ